MIDITAVITPFISIDMSYESDIDKHDELMITIYMIDVDRLPNEKIPSLPSQCILYDCNVNVDANEVRAIQSSFTLVNTMINLISNEQTGQFYKSITGDT